MQPIAAAANDYWQQLQKHSFITNNDWKTICGRHFDEHILLQLNASARSWKLMASSLFNSIAIMLHSIWSDFPSSAAHHLLLLNHDDGAVSLITLHPWTLLTENERTKEQIKQSSLCAFIRVNTFIRELMGFDDDGKQIPSIRTTLTVQQFMGWLLHCLNNN